MKKKIYDKKKKEKEKKNPKQNLPESDSENEITEFPRIILIKSLDKTSLGKLSPSLIERGIFRRMNP